MIFEFIDANLFDIGPEKQSDGWKKSDLRGKLAQQFHGEVKTWAFIMLRPIVFFYFRIYKDKLLCCILHDYYLLILCILAMK
jgi:hypothetical protein